MNIQRGQDVTNALLGSLSATLSAVNEVIASSTTPVATKPLSQRLQYELMKRITSPNIECRMLLLELEVPEIPSRKVKRQKLVNDSDKKGSKQKMDISSQEVINLSESETPIDEDLLALHFAGLICNVSSDMTFGEHLRISPSSFEVFLQKIGPHLSASDINHRSYTVKIGYVTKLKISLLAIATELSFREVGAQFDMSRSMAHYVFQEFCNGMMKIAPTIVKWPDADNMKEIRDFYEKEYNIPGIIGVLDSCYFGVCAAQKNSNILALLQAVVNHEGKFLDVFTACPATNGDQAQMFDVSPLRVNLNSLIPDGCVLAASSNYPFQTKLLTPYQDNGTLMYDELTYNQSHSQIMKKALATFDELTFKFHRLKCMNMTRSDKNAKLIVSACCLHNLMKDSNKLSVENDLDVDEPNLIYSETF